MSEKMILWRKRGRCKSDKSLVFSYWLNPSLRKKMQSGKIHPNLLVVHQNFFSNASTSADAAFSSLE
jgi:hypothetical protein